jgi:hypothetical protein
MNISQKLKKIVAVVVTANFVSLGMLSSIAQAGMISTQEMTQVAQLNYDRTQIIQLINDQQVQDQLVSLGVDPADAEARINSMTESELTELSQNLGELPAGSGVLGVVVLIFVVFVITDAIGATDIFPFVNSVN